MTDKEIIDTLNAAANLIADEWPVGHSISQPVLDNIEKAIKELESRQPS